MKIRGRGQRTNISTVFNRRRYEVCRVRQTYAEVLGEELCEVMETDGVFTTVTENVTANATVAGQYGEAIEEGLFTKYVEMCLLLLFLAVWLASMVCFFTRWNNVSLMQPYGNVLYVPRNLESVTVVQKEEESVIYCR